MLTTRVIIIAGDNDAGKTTLMVSLFDRFCDGPFGGYIFGGSTSLIAFDRRAHTGYTRSDGTAADTVRTAHTLEINFLHMKLRDAECVAPCRNLLLSDIAGETCKRARNSASECMKLGILRRADRLLLAIDGDRLSSNRFRDAAASDAINLFRRFAESGVLQRRTPVDFVVTKWDKVALSRSEDGVRAIVATMRDTIARLPSARGFNLEWHETAARPDSLETFQHCHGMVDFPRKWCDGGACPSIGREAISDTASLDMDRFECPRMAE